MKRKKDQLQPAIDQADKLLSVVTGRQFSAVEQLSDPEFDRMFRLGIKALFLQAVAKSQEAMASITPEDLAGSSGTQKAVIAGILADKAEKLAKIMEVSQAPGAQMSPTDFTNLVQSIRGRVTKLSALGVELTVSDPMYGNGSSFGAEPFGAIEAHHEEVPDSE